MTVATESFNKADSATLGPDQVWNEHTGGSLNVVSNQCSNTASGEQAAEVQSTLTGDGHSQIEFRSGSKYNIRATIWGSGNTHYLALAHNTVGVRIYKVIAGTYTQLGATCSAGSCFLSSGDTLRVRVAGSSPATIYADVNGVNKVSTTDSSVGPNGYPGLSIQSVGGDPATYLDNWQADVDGSDPPDETSASVRRVDMIGGRHR